MVFNLGALNFLLNDPAGAAEMLAQRGVEPQGLQAMLQPAAATPNTPGALQTAQSVPTGAGLAQEVGNAPVHPAPTLPAIDPGLIAGDTGVGAPNPSGFAGGAAAMPAINPMTLGLLGQAIQPATAPQPPRPTAVAPARGSGQIDPALLTRLLQSLQPQGQTAIPTLGALIGGGR